MPREVDQRIHNPDSDSSHITGESVDLTNLDSTDYGCEIRLLTVANSGMQKRHIRTAGQ